MKISYLGAILAAALALAPLSEGRAQGLRVSPVVLDVPAPGATATLTLRNEGRGPVTIQSRSFRWRQNGGRETLERTSDLVVSPPATRLPPGASQTIRVVRTAKTPLRSEEAYRVIINEIPDQSRRQGGAVAFTTELRIPVFFTPQGARNAAVSWSLQRHGRTDYLVGRNRGEVRLRLSDITLTGTGGTVVRRPGLVGYVLGGSTVQWPIASAGTLGTGARLRGRGSLGGIDERLQMQ